MISFHSISSFRKSLRNLTSRPKDGFASLISDICNEFKDKTIEDIRNAQTICFREEKYHVTKIRIAVSSNNTGKSNGVRLYFIVLEEKDQVYFLDVYPKKGAQSMLNISNNILKGYFNDIANEIRSGLIAIHNIENNLEVSSSINKSSEDIRPDRGVDVQIPKETIKTTET